MNDVVVRLPDAPRAPGWVRLVLVSDTHNVDIPISLFPPGDLLIHAGDHTMMGLWSELTGAAANQGGSHAMKEGFRPWVVDIRVGGRESRTS